MSLAEIDARFQNFCNVLNEVNTPPISVFAPISQKQTEELELIREISVCLQKKKDEDIKKQQQADAELEKIAAEKEAAEALEAEQEEQKEKESTE